MLTGGGYAPCLSSAIAGLVTRYSELAPDVELIGYTHGYHGLLTGSAIVVDDEARRTIDRLHHFGGSPIGNSRVKLTNRADLIKRGLVGLTRVGTRPGTGDHSSGPGLLGLPWSLWLGSALRHLGDQRGLLKQSGGLRNHRTHPQPEHQVQQGEPVAHAEIADHLNPQQNQANHPARDVEEEAPVRVFGDIDHQDHKLQQLWAIKQRR